MKKTIALLSLLAGSAAFAVMTANATPSVTTLAGSPNYILADDDSSGDSTANSGSQDMAQRKTQMPKRLQAIKLITVITIALMTAQLMPMLTAMAAALTTTAIIINYRPKKGGRVSQLAL